MPGLAVAAEAFLLTIALPASTAPAGRVVAATAGLIVISGAMHFIGKQAYNFDLYNSLIERQRERLNRMSLHREVIEKLEIPCHAKPRRTSWLVRSFGAIQWWRGVLLALLLIDLAILVYGVLEWSGTDLGWLRALASSSL